MTAAPSRWTIASAALVLAAGALWIAFPSASLDDVDGFLFLRGVERFDPAAGRPHPPGYVFAIYAAQALNALVGDPERALALLSALSAAAGLGAFHAILRLYADREAAFWGTALLAANFSYALLAQKAMTDAPGVAAHLTAVYALLRALRDEDRRWLIAGALTAALATGVRPHGLAVTGAMLVWMLSSSWTSGGRLQAIGAHAAGQALWIGATAVAAGPQRYAADLWRQFSARFEPYPGWSVLADPAPSVGGYLDWAGDYAIALALAFGFDPDAPRAAHAGALIVGAAGLIGALRAARRDARVAAPIAIGVGLYGLILFFFLPPTNSRYLIALAPLAAAGLAVGMRRRDALSRFACGGAVAASLLATVPAATELATTPSPPARFIAAANAAFDASAFVVNETHGTRFWFSQTVAARRIEPPRCAQLLRFLDNGFTILATQWDRSRCPAVRPTLIGRFERDRRLHRKHHALALFKLDPPQR